MAASNVNAKVTIQSKQQKVSKILMSQLVSAMTELVQFCDDQNRMKSCVAYKIATSIPHTNGCIGSWNRGDMFSFTFEYGRKSVRVSYVNSDGLMSAVFSFDQWSVMTKFIRHKLDRIIEDRLVQLEIERQEAEREEFERKVRRIVDEAILDRELAKAGMPKYTATE